MFSTLPKEYSATFYVSSAYAPYFNKSQIMIVFW